MIALKATTIMGSAYKKMFSTKCISLSYSDYGDPIKVISRVEEDVRAPIKGEVMIKMIAAPVNPADINTIEGKYPVKPKLPAIAGNEGIGEVICVGEAVSAFREGDRVLPVRSGLGTWRTLGVFSENDLVKVPNELGKAEGSMLTVNPCTAYRMIKDFADLKPGDTVVQNGANSACGQNVIQLCKAWAINTVNIVRNRPEIGDLKNYLADIGANYVFTEEEVRTTDIFKSGFVKKPKLALNCVGGKSALEIMRQLDHGGALVTYGGMSRDPVTVPTSALIFKDIRVYGYWMTRWNKENLQNPKRMEMFNDLIQLILSKKLHAPAYQYIKFENYKEALMNTLSVQGFTGKKYILDFEN